MHRQLSHTAPGEHVLSGRFRRRFGIRWCSRTGTRGNTSGGVTSAGALQRVSTTKAQPQPWKHLFERRGNERAGSASSSAAACNKQPSRRQCYGRSHQPDMVSLSRLRVGAGGRWLWASSIDSGGQAVFLWRPAASVPLGAVSGFGCIPLSAVPSLHSNKSARQMQEGGRF